MTVIRNDTREFARHYHNDNKRMNVSIPPLDITNYTKCRPLLQDNTCPFDKSLQCFSVSHCITVVQALMNAGYMVQ